MMREAALPISRTAAYMPGEIRQAERQSPHSEPLNPGQRKITLSKNLRNSLPPKRGGKVKNRRMEFSLSTEQTQPRNLTYSF